MLRVSGLTEPQYLRTVGLQKWTPGEGWSVDDLSDGDLPGGPAAPGDAREVTVTSLAYRDEFLPIYDGTTSVDRSRAGLVLRRRPGVGAPRGHGVARPVPDRRRPSASRPPTSCGPTRSTPGGTLTETGDLPDEVVQVAQQVTARCDHRRSTRPTRCARTSPTRRTASSTRSTVPQGDSGDQLVDFLNNKQGYCEQYASAMAIMLRAIGVPARVAIGFTQGMQQTRRQLSDQQQRRPRLGRGALRQRRLGPVRPHPAGRRPRRSTGLHRHRADGPEQLRGAGDVAVGPAAERRADVGRYRSGRSAARRGSERGERHGRGRPRYPGRAVVGAGRPRTAGSGGRRTDNRPEPPPHQQARRSPTPADPVQRQPPGARSRTLRSTTESC